MHAAYERQMRALSEEIERLRQVERGAAAARAEGSLLQ
jgi:hypothetical protein